MDNKWQVIESIDALQSFQQKTKIVGYSYCIEYGDFIKIGKSSKIYQRIYALDLQARHYSGFPIGRIAISPLHLEYHKTEYILHQFFQSVRMEKSELFRMSFDAFLTDLPYIDYSYSSSKYNNLEEEVYDRSNISLKNIKVIDDIMTRFIVEPIEPIEPIFSIKNLLMQLEQIIETLNDTGLNYKDQISKAAEIIEITHNVDLFDLLGIDPAKWNASYPNIDNNCMNELV